MRTATLRSVVLLVLAATLTLGSATHAQKLLWEYRVETPPGFNDDNAGFLYMDPELSHPFYVSATGSVVLCASFYADGMTMTRFIALSSKGAFVGKVDFSETPENAVTPLAVAAVTPTRLSLVIRRGAEDTFLKSYTLNKTGTFVESGSVVIPQTYGATYQGIEANKSPSGVVVYGLDDSGLWIRRYSAF